MSDIPSHLSKWEPPRALKAGFLAAAALSLAALFGAKIYSHFVIDRMKVEQAIDAERRTGQAPGFRLAAKDGTPVALEQFRGKLVFLNFWATWCGPCREEMPSLGQLARTVDPNDVVFLAVSVDDGWDPVDEFLGSGAKPYTVLLDKDKSVSTAYGTTVFPESFLIGREGEILYKFTGARDWSATAALKILERAGAHRLPMRAPGGA